MPCLAELSSVYHGFGKAGIPRSTYRLRSRFLRRNDSVGAVPDVVTVAHEGMAVHAVQPICNFAAGSCGPFGHWLVRLTPAWRADCRLRTVRAVARRSPTVRVRTRGGDCPLADPSGSLGLRVVWGPSCIATTGVESGDRFVRIFGLLRPVLLGSAVPLLSAAIRNYRAKFWVVLFERIGPFHGHTVRTL